jgi:hypothetical protein
MISLKNFRWLAYGVLVIFLWSGCKQNMIATTPTTVPVTLSSVVTEEHDFDVQPPVETVTPEMTPWPQSTNDKLRRIFTSELNCFSPCWLGLVPGQATRADVLDVLNNNNVDDLSVDDPSTVSWTEALFYAYGRFRGDILEILIFRVGDPLLSEAVAVLGEPDSYQLSVARGQHGEFGWQLMLFYDEHGLVLWTNTWDVMEPEQSNFQPECQDVVNASNVSITEIYIVDPQLLLEYDSFTETELPYEFRGWVTERQEWPGFGTVSVTDCWPGTVQ